MSVPHIPNPHALLLSDQFVISCGAVTLDLQRSKVLLVLWRRNFEVVPEVVNEGGKLYRAVVVRTDKVLLPKGRKEAKETLEATAVREFFQGTGVEAQLLPAGVVTTANPPSSEDDPDFLTTEPIAVTQRGENDELSIVFWYIAVADSTIPLAKSPEAKWENYEWDEEEMEEHTDKPDIPYKLEEGQDFISFWEDIDTALSTTLSYSLERRILVEALSAIERGKTNEAMME